LIELNFKGGKTMKKFHLIVFVFLFASCNGVNSQGNGSQLSEKIKISKVFTSKNSFNTFALDHRGEVWGWGGSNEYNSLGTPVPGTPLFPQKIEFNDLFEGEKIVDIIIGNGRNVGGYNYASLFTLFITNQNRFYFSGFLSPIGNGFSSPSSSFSSSLNTEGFSTHSNLNHLVISMQNLPQLINLKLLTSNENIDQIYPYYHNSFIVKATNHYYAVSIMADDNTREIYFESEIITPPELLEGETISHIYRDDRSGDYIITNQNNIYFSAWNSDNPYKLENNITPLVGEDFMDYISFSMLPVSSRDLFYASWIITTNHRLVNLDNQEVIFENLVNNEFIKDIVIAQHHGMVLTNLNRILSFGHIVGSGFLFTDNLYHLPDYPFLPEKAFPTNLQMLEEGETISNIYVGFFTSLILTNLGNVFIWGGFNNGLSSVLLGLGPNNDYAFLPTQVVFKP
jgi:hypothetical protein